ncbi:MAG: Uma2 family endonuclease [Candidatus Methylomirabilia bacterium]
MAAERVILTYKDYEALPADGRRYELHDGELSVTLAPSPLHQHILGNLNEIVRQHVKTHGLGEILFAPIDCILSETTILRPDLVYLDASRLSLVSARGIEGAPTLVVEILSPSTTLIDRSTKLQLYARYGAPYYWIVDPEARIIEVHVLSGGAYQLVARAAGLQAVSLLPFPDLALVPASLWP